MRNVGCLDSRDNRFESCSSPLLREKVHFINAHQSSILHDLEIVVLPSTSDGIPLLRGEDNDICLVNLRLFLESGISRHFNDAQAKLRKFLIPVTEAPEQRDLRGAR